jgi:hypothetical protein
MFERLQKPFLTVETGEAYQPIRLTYRLRDKANLIATLNKLKCLEKNSPSNHWNWYWKEECDDLHFESIDAFKRRPERPIRLGTILIRNEKLYFNLPSFKRACLAVPFFFRMLDLEATKISKADFINKVFGLDERLPHGFAELFKEEELEKIVNERIHEYEAVEKKVEEAETAEEALTILSTYTDKEAKKRLPYAERYTFDHADSIDPEVVFLSFYIFMRSRELVAIRRWFGETGFNLANVVDETVEQVFGGMHIDIIE